MNFEAQAKQLLNKCENNKAYFAKLCDLFNDYYRKYEAVMSLIDQGDDKLPGFKITMPWSFEGSDNIYTNISTNHTTCQQATTRLINFGKHLEIIKEVIEK